MKNISRLASQRGLSLVEAALASAVLGVAAVTLSQFAAMHQRVDADDRDSAMLDRAAASVAHYAFLNNRAPCPAPDVNGNANCDGKLAGSLPYLTLGLPDPAAGQVKYELAAASLLAAPAFQPLVAVSTGSSANLTPAFTPITALVTASYDHALDFCAALQDPAVSARPAITLTSSPPAARPDAPVVSKVITHAVLAGQLQCASLLATAGRAHFNTRLAADAMHRSLVDYKTQFDISFGLSEFDLAQGVWFISNMIYGSAKGVTKFILGTATLFGSEFKEWSPMAKAAVVIPSTVGYTGMLVSNVTRFSYMLDAARKNRTEMNRIVAATRALTLEIARNASLSAGSRFYLAEQGLPAVRAVPASPLPPGAYENGGEYAQVAKDFIAAMGGDAITGSDLSAALHNADAAGDGALSAACAKQPGSAQCQAHVDQAGDASLKAACDIPGSHACNAYIRKLAEGASP